MCQSFSDSYSLRGCEIWTPTEYLESRSKSWKLLVGKSVSTSVSDILQYTNTIQCRYKFDCLKGLAFVKICCISHAIILINFEVRWGSIILTLINRLLDLDHQCINPGARLIYSLVTPYILSIQLLDALIRIQSYEFMINWLLACLTPQHTSNKSAEKPLKDYSQKTFQGFSHLSDLWWKEVRKVSEMKKYLLL